MWVCRTMLSRGVTEPPPGCPRPAAGGQRSAGRARSRAQHGEQIQTALQADTAQREVARADGGREAVIERLGEAQALVHVIPAEPLDRDLVRAQLAGVEEPEQVDLAEVALAQRAVLVGAVLADVPRVARARLALGREREDVRGRDVRHAVRPDE